MNDLEIKFAKVSDLILVSADKAVAESMAVCRKFTKDGIAAILAARAVVGDFAYNKNLAEELGYLSEDSMINAFNSASYQHNALIDLGRNVLRFAAKNENFELRKNSIKENIQL